MSGFAGRELFAPNDLVFQQTLSQRVNTYPTTSKSLNDRLRATEKQLPAFPYDTSPHEEPRTAVDSLFFEAWADVLVGGGWARDELKESSFALIQWKSRPRVTDIGKSRSPGSSTSGDPRTEDSWVLVEEFVPREYREALTDPKVRQLEQARHDSKMTDRTGSAHLLQVKKQPKRISFLRTVRRKNTLSPKSNPSAAVLLSPPLSSSRGVGISSTSTATSSPSSLRPIDESVFSNDFAQTTKVSLSNPVERNSYAPFTYAPTSYAPSFVSTVAANDGHAALSNLSLSNQNDHRPYSPPPPVPSNETYGINMNGSSKSPKRGLLARINTMRNREKSRNDKTGGPVEQVMPAPAQYEYATGGEMESRSPVWSDARVRASSLNRRLVASAAHNTILAA